MRTPIPPKSPFRNRKISQLRERRYLHSAHTLWKRFQRKGIWSRIIGITILSVVFAIMLIWAIFLRGLPSIDTLATGDYFRESTTIYDNSGGVIYSLFKDGKRTYVTSADISQSLKDAIISTEDRTFFENPGIDTV